MGEESGIQKPRDIPNHKKRNSRRNVTQLLLNRKLKSFIPLSYYWCGILLH